MSTLKNIIVVSAKLGNGTSNKSGSPKPYQFANVTYLKNAESFVNDQHNIQMVGFDAQEINMLFDNALFEKFKASCPFGRTVDLILDADPQNPSRNVVVDFKVINDKAV